MLRQYSLTSMFFSFFKVAGSGSVYALAAGMNVAGRASEGRNRSPPAGWTSYLQTAFPLLAAISFRVFQKAK
jgi:hypothetical protein